MFLPQKIKWLGLAVVFWTGLPQLHADQGPWQSWLTASISQRLDYGLEWILESEARFADEGDLWRRLEITPQLIWHYSPRYDFGLGYENSREDLANGQDEEGHEGLAFVTVKIPLKSWEISSRQQFRFGIMDESVEETSSVLLFRHRVRVDYKGPGIPFKLVPFVQDEWFFDLEEGELSENRAMAGLAYGVNDHVSLEVYGMRMDEWKMEERHEWSPVFGISLSMEF